jgi:hypothetical protein
MATTPGEPLWVYLERRERELLNLSAALRGDLKAVEDELAHVQSAKRQIGNLGSADQARFGGSTTRLGQVTAPNVLAPYKLNPDDATPTIKQLVMKALLTQFDQQGATPTEIRQFIHDAYKREISSKSLSPQLSRLKYDDLLKQKDGDRWYLTVKGRDRSRYLMMYDHPTSRATIPELQDDDVPLATENLTFTVVKKFNSATQRFREGTTLEFKDQAELDAFKKSLHPLDLDHLVKQGFLEAQS